MSYLLFHPTIERSQPDEQEAIDGIIQGMLQQSETVAEREHHAVRLARQEHRAVGVEDRTYPRADRLRYEVRSIDGESTTGQD